MGPVKMADIRSLICGNLQSIVLPAFPKQRVTLCPKLRSIERESLHAVCIGHVQG